MPGVQRDRGGIDRFAHRSATCDMYCTCTWLGSATSACPRAPRCAHMYISKPAKACWPGSACLRFVPAPLPALCTAARAAWPAGAQTDECAVPGMFGRAMRLMLIMWMWIAGNAAGPAGAAWQARAAAAVAVSTCPCRGLACPACAPAVCHSHSCARSRRGCDMAAATWFSPGTRHSTARNRLLRAPMACCSRVRMRTSGSC
jgi:hypothetical protein